MTLIIVWFIGVKILPNRDVPLLLSIVPGRHRSRSDELKKTITSITLHNQHLTNDTLIAREEFTPPDHQDMAEVTVPCPTNAKECEASIPEKFLTLHLLNDHKCGICPLGTAEKHNPFLVDKVSFLVVDGKAYVQAKYGLANSLNKTKETLALACGCVWSYRDMNYSWYEPGQKFCFRYYDGLGTQNDVTTCPGGWGDSCEMIIPNKERWAGHMLACHDAGVCPLGGFTKHIATGMLRSLPAKKIFEVMPDGVAYAKVNDQEETHELKCGCSFDRDKEREAFQIE
jgi:hypothetical protein